MKSLCQWINAPSPILLSCLAACLLLQTLGAAVAPATLQGTLLPFILSFCSDPVPNLRFNVAKSLERLASRVDAPVRAASIRPALERLAADGEEDVRYYAARALANVG